MTNYAPNYTDRVIARYRSHSANHQVTIRPLGDEGQVGGTTALGDMLTALKPYVVAHGPNDFTWLDASFIGAGQELSTPLTLPAVATTSWAGGNAVFKPYTAIETSWEARGAGGALYSISIFGLQNASGDDGSSPGRITPAESVAFVQTLGLLKAITTCGAVDNTALVWKNYANYGQNAYWKRKVRNG